MVVKTPVAFHVAFLSEGGFGRGYPGSLMGIIAFFKQTLLDARHYGAAWRLYDSTPGTPRPERNKALEALQPVVIQNSPVVMTGDGPVEIQRILDLAGQFKLNLILSGATRASRIAATLRDRNVPVLLSVKFPERERDGDPEEREEFNRLRDRVEAPGTAAALAKAGVKFAFQSADIANPRDFMRNVGKAVEAGLDRDVALRALTLTPAEFFGVADRFGSIDRGKTANLVVATGDIFNPETRVKVVFIDGRKFEITESEPPRESAPPGGSEAGPVLTLTGAWNVTVDTPQGAVAATFQLQQAGSAVTGTVSSPVGNAEITDGKVVGNTLTFRLSGAGMVVSGSATIDGPRITGTLSGDEVGSMGFSGTRVQPGPQQGGNHE